MTQHSAVAVSFILVQCVGYIDSVTLSRTCRTLTVFGAGAASDTSDARYVSRRVCLVLMTQVIS